MAIIVSMYMKIISPILASLGATTAWKEQPSASTSVQTCTIMIRSSGIGQKSKRSVVPSKLHVVAPREAEKLLIIMLTSSIQSC